MIARLNVRNDVTDKLSELPLIVILQPSRKEPSVCRLSGILFGGGDVEDSSKHPLANNVRIALQSSNHEIFGLLVSFSRFTIRLATRDIWVYAHTSTRWATFVRITIILRMKYNIVVAATWAV